MTKVTPEEIDALLPQTQCGLCNHGGCMPYAEAIVYEQAPINLCPPGGMTTLQKLGRLLDVNPAPYYEEMEKKAKPPMVAVVRESECIGCTKCIKACPVDAILGSAKQMHTVIANECTGCELCIAPCPVDCIDLVAVAEAVNPDQARQRFNARNYRLQREKELKKVKAKPDSAKISYVQQAIARARAKKECR